MDKIFRLVGQVVIENDEAKSKIRETTGEAEQSSGGMVNAFKKVGAAVATYLAVDRVIAFGTACVQAAATVKAQTAQFEAAFGDIQGEATKMFDGLSESTGVLATRLRTVGTGAFSQFKGAGLDAAEALKKTETYTNLAADAAAYYDMSLEEADRLMRSFIRGNTEAGDRLGLFTSEAQRNDAAMEKLGKKYINCTEAEKQMIMLDIASEIYKNSGAMGQAAREADGYENVMGNLREAWRQFQAVVGQPILEAVIPVIQNVTNKILNLKDKVAVLIEKFKENKDTIKQVAQEFALFAGVYAAWKVGTQINNMVKGFQQAKLTLSLLSMEVGKANLAQAALNGTLTFGETIVALLTGKITLAQLATATWTKVTAALNAVWTANPIGVVIAAIAALIAIIVLCVKHWDKIKAAVVSFWNKCKEVFAPLGKWFTDKVINPIKKAFEKMKTTVSNVFKSIGNAIKIAFQLIASIISAAFQIITLPYRFIWENCKDIVFKAFEAIKSYISKGINKAKSIISTVMNAIRNVFSTVWNAVSTKVSTVFNSIKTKVSNVLNSVKNTVSTIFNSIKTKISNVVNSVKTAVGNAFTAVKTRISNPLKSAYTSVKNTFSNIYESIKNKLNQAKNKVKSVIDSIKGFFKFKVSLPKIELPHFAISPKGWKFGDLLKGSVPKLSIDWYKKAMNSPMILDKPSIFGYDPSTGNLMGGGEAGSEVVAGASRLMNMIRAAVSEGNNTATLDKVYALLNAYLPMLVRRELVLDSGTLVGELAPQMDEELGRIHDWKVNK